MGLIEHMAKKGAPKGVKLPQPTTAGDDQLIAAKTGEYVLPPEVVAMIGVDKLDAMVAQMTGRQPGGEPAEMPEGPTHEMMEGEAEGYAKGGKVKGYALGGAISKFDGVSLDPYAKRPLDKYTFDSQGSALDDSVSRQVSRSAKGMAQSDEVWDAARPKLEERMTRSPNGLLAQLMGYAEGGLIEDDPLRRRLNAYNPNAEVRQPMAGRPAPVDVNALRNYTPHQTIRQPVGPGAPAPADVQNLRNYNPQASIPPNATTNASPRAPELRNFTPEPGRLQPGGVTPRISGLAAQAPQSIASPSRTVAELDARAASLNMETAKRGVQQVQANRLSAEAMNPGKGTIRGLAGAAVVPVAEAAGQFAIGEDAGVRNQFYNDPNVGTLEKAKQFGRDAAGIALPTVGAAVGAGAGSVVAPVAGTAAGGVAGYGIGKGADSLLQSALGESALDRYKAQQPQQTAQAPALSPQENAAEIARRRSALEPQQSFEQKIGKFIADERAMPAAAAPSRPARGPVSGLAARAAKPQAAQPAAPQIDPAVMAGAQAAQAELDQSPIARVIWGSGGATVQYKDGTAKQAGPGQLDEVNAFHALTNRASQQYDAQPVEVIAGASRAVALPEQGYQLAPKSVADAGKAGEYFQGIAQGAIDRADPLGAEQRNALGLLTARTNEAIRADRATAGAGRGVDNERKKLENSLVMQAVNGTPEQKADALAKLTTLRTAMGGGQNAKERYLTVPGGQTVGPDGYSVMTAPSVLFDTQTQQPVNLGTVQSNSTPAAPQKGAVVKGYRFNGGDPANRANWSKAQ